jgi:hypothetical protein
MSSLTGVARRQLPMTDEEQVTLLLDRINDAWSGGYSQTLAPTLEECFHKDMVIRVGSFDTLASGRKACVQSYVDFVRQAKIIDCSFFLPRIDVYGDTAVAGYSWEMTYSIGSQEIHERGDDLFVFVRTAGRWQAAWRMLLPDDREGSTGQAGNDD